MAYYVDPKFLEKGKGAVFDTTHAPGAKTPHPGIYRCKACGKEITSSQDHPLPPQTHHTHRPGQGPIAWQLIVATKLTS